MNLTLSQLQAWLPKAVPANTSALNVADSVIQIKAVRTDSRSVVAGDLFVALKGEKFDGTAFLKQAQSQGAVAVILEADDLAQGEHLKHLAGVTVPALCVPNW